MLNVGGYADAPVITLKQHTEQPQDQILRGCCFGADPRSSRTLQVAQIAAGAGDNERRGRRTQPADGRAAQLRLDRWRSAATPRARRPRRSLGPGNQYRSDDRGGAAT